MIEAFDNHIVKKHSSCKRHTEIYQDPSVPLIIVVRILRWTRLRCMEAVVGHLFPGKTEQSPYCLFLLLVDRGRLGRKRLRE